MRKLVFGKFYIEMNEQDVARIVSEFLKSVSSGNVQLHEWRFAVMNSTDVGHEVAFSYRLKKLDVKIIEAQLEQIHQINVNIDDVRLDNAAESYLVVYMPKG